MSRLGKIARLPGSIRDQINHRLHDGAFGDDILAWLGAQPEVTNILTTHFQNRPITKQNLSNWRQGGYQVWLLQHEIIASAMKSANLYPPLQSS